MLSNVATSMRIAVWLAQLLWVGLVLLMWWNFIPSSAAQQTTVAVQSATLLLVGLAVATSVTKVLREVEDAAVRRQSAVESDRLQARRERVEKHILERQR